VSHGHTGTWQRDLSQKKGSLLRPLSNDIGLFRQKGSLLRPLSKDIGLFRQKGSLLRPLSKDKGSLLRPHFSQKRGLFWPLTKHWSLSSKGVSFETPLKRHRSLLRPHLSLKRRLFWPLTKKLVYLRKETYVSDQRDLFGLSVDLHLHRLCRWRKRPVYLTQETKRVYLTKETYVSNQRDLCRWQKRPMYLTQETYDFSLVYLTKETYVSDQRDLFGKENSYVDDKRDLCIYIGLCCHLHRSLWRKRPMSQTKEFSLVWV